MMANLNIYFSDEEMVTFLEKRGYTITEVDCWDSHNAYYNNMEYTDHKVEIAHYYNNVEYTDHKVEIAHKDIGLAEVLTDKRKGEVEKYSIENVFHKEMKQSLLKL